MYQGLVRVVGIRYVKPTLNVESYDNLRLLLDVMIDDGVGMLKTNLKMSVMEYGEAPGLGEFIYALIKDDKIRLID